jgi:2-iminobutanoate/2-iminopropanoate deaminase
MTTISTTAAPRPAGAYSQARRLGPFLQVSGQIGVDLETGKLLEGITEQTEAAMQHIGSLLIAAGAKWQDVLSLRVYLSTDDDFEQMDEAVRKHLGDNFPPRVTVAAGLAPGALVEIDALAVLPDHVFAVPADR